MENLFNEILGMSVDAVWLIIAVLMGRLVLHKAPVYFRKILWGLVGLRLIIPFSFKSVLSLVPREGTVAVDEVVQQTVSLPDEQRLSFLNIVAVVWVAVGVAFLVYGIISYLKLKRRIFDGVLYKENIYFSEKIESPFVCGFMKPKIYLPYGLEEESQKYVLQHEKTHIKYADHIIKAVGFVILCVHWFNPLVWVSYFLLCKDIELSCDESVVRNYDADGCKQYAKALLELGVNKVKLSACPVAFGEVSIKSRIKSVINYKKAGKVLICASLALCIAVAVCFMTEPAVQAKKADVEEAVEKIPETTEPVTEKLTEPTTEIAEETTEPATESATEPLAESAEVVTEAEEVYDDSEFENEEDGLADDSLNEINLLEPVFADPPQVTSIYEGVTYNDFGSNSSVLGNNQSNTVTLPSFNWDPAVTQAPAYNYGNTNHPHFEGNQWVYN